MFNVLFLCTGNSARSVMAESILDRLGAGKLKINWLVKPFSMALLGWLFIRVLFALWLPADQLDSYIAGLIILAAAPCTAMVFVWSNLSGGETHFTLSQAALNDVIMIFAFAPIVGLLLGISAIHVPLDTLFLSVIIYTVIPVSISQLLRKFLLRHEGLLEKTLKQLQPASLYDDTHLKFEHVAHPSRTASWELGNMRYIA